MAPKPKPKMPMAHPGFQAVAAGMADQMKPMHTGETKMQAAQAALAASTRKASPAAKRKNPRLKKVK